MSKFIKNAESTAPSILPIERNDYYVYIRTNIVRVEEPEIEGVSFARKYWRYDEEVLTHTEYIDRLENQITLQQEANINTMVGLAELYEALYEKEIV